MAYLAVCPACQGEFHIFNYRETMFNCPLCRKRLESSRVSRKKIKSLKCAGCGACCRFVPDLSKEDIQRLTKNLSDWEQKAYQQKGNWHFYTVDSKGRYRTNLTAEKDCYCVFYSRETHLCQIHNFKPHQCRELEASFSCQGEKKPEIDFSRI